jgi:hypothetical protein
MTIHLFNAIESALLKIFKKIKKDYGIIILGKREEVNPQVLKKNYPLYDDMYQTIGLLRNHVKLLIAPDSGFIDLAKNCAVKNIIMVYEGDYLDYHNIFNPFKTNFQSIDYQKEFLCFDSIMEKIL